MKFQQHRIIENKSNFNSRLIVCTDITWAAAIQDFKLHNFGILIEFDFTARLQVFVQACVFENI